MMKRIVLMVTVATMMALFLAMAGPAFAGHQDQGGNIRHGCVGVVTSDEMNPFGQPKNFPLCGVVSDWSVLTEASVWGA